MFPVVCFCTFTLENKGNNVADQICIKAEKSQTVSKTFGFQ